MFKKILLCSALCVIPSGSFSSAASLQSAVSPADRFSQQFWQQADTLRPKLDSWKNTVDSFGFSQIKLGKDGSVILHTLDGDKQQCLHSLSTLWLEIPNIERMHGPGLEYQAMLHIVHLENQLLKLQSDMEIAYSVGLSSGGMTIDDPASQQLRDWLQSVSNMAADLGNNFEMRMQDELRVVLGILQVQLTQCQAQKPPTP